MAEQVLLAVAHAAAFHAAVNALPGAVESAFLNYLVGRLRDRRRPGRQVRCTNPVRRRTGGEGRTCRRLSRNP